MTTPKDESDQPVPLQPSTLSGNDNRARLNYESFLAFILIGSAIAGCSLDQRIGITLLIVTLAILFVMGAWGKR